ncbi:hypothetical protein SPRG_02169 [Saprolegnia parasitica CBS 223.65]|uniref:Uncharacterized protein n=1 Tax=Saprolegnia parasitica (strain CBS 223.65) TaxID=695850 RepID=A0A067D2V7_SAPPC|nr:hypothetical protein SPRG_02169 [Saprolegnia parasitica CBS 223.65]KDO33362.1 hypothetical protein SPRG_02169 [Saprolegnia parasitica CBS 223.65]|eukprot:XP_012196110.1 hypothetical protein SPRG_02169 [Saprolegnia parasitica CBS 223.65]
MADDAQQVFYFEEIPIEDETEDGAAKEAVASYKRVDSAVRGDVPAKRGGATLSVVEANGEKLLYLIGGANREARMFNDVHVYNVGTGAWSQVYVTNSAVFQARSGHSAVVLGTRIFVFGGLNLPLQTTFNDVHILDTATKSWSTPVVQNDPPRPRNAHIAMATTKGMVVFGGSSPTDGPMSDVFLLTVHEPTLRWVRIDCNGPVMAPRELHAAVLVSLPTERIYVSGGRLQDGQLCREVATLDVASWTWTIQSSGEFRRCGHVIGLLDAACIVQYGGWDGGNGFCNDCWEHPLGDDGQLAPATLEEARSGDHVLLEDGADVVHDGGRLGHTACVVDTRLFVFGA